MESPCSEVSSAKALAWVAWDRESLWPQTREISTPTPQRWSSRSSRRTARVSRLSAWPPSFKLSPWISRLTGPSRPKRADSQTPFSRSGSQTPWRQRLVEQPDDFLNRPDVLGNARFHRWRNPRRLVDAGEVVEHEVERDRRRADPRPERPPVAQRPIRPEKAGSRQQALVFFPARRRSLLRDRLPLGRRQGFGSGSAALGPAQLPQRDRSRILHRRWRQRRAIQPFTDGARYDAARDRGEVVIAGCAGTLRLGRFRLGCA
jgi:hypothetical protein